MGHVLTSCLLILVLHPPGYTSCRVFNLPLIPEKVHSVTDYPQSRWSRIYCHTESQRKSKPLINQQVGRGAGLGNQMVGMTDTHSEERSDRSSRVKITYYITISFYKFSISQQNNMIAPGPNVAFNTDVTQRASSADC